MKPIAHDEFVFTNDEEQLMEMARYTIRGKFDEQELHIATLKSYFKEIMAFWRLLKMSIDAVFGSETRKWKDPWHSARVMWFMCFMLEHPNYIWLLILLAVLWISFVNYCKQRKATTLKDSHEFRRWCPSIYMLMIQLCTGSPGFVCENYGSKQKGSLELPKIRHDMEWENMFGVKAGPQQKKEEKPSKFKETTSLHQNRKEGMVESALPDWMVLVQVSFGVGKGRGWGQAHLCSSLCASGSIEMCTRKYVRTCV